jgi:four helix bundle protein
MDDPKGLAEWAATAVPAVIREDPIWRLPAYRYSLYLADRIKADAPRLRQTETKKTVDQLLDAAYSISINIDEGYSRTTGPERAKFYEYANGSARETRQWLFKVRDSLGAELTAEYLELASRIIRILTAVIPRERARRESPARRRRTPRQSASDQHEPPATSQQESR